jgi:maltooligosyltrehalose trehalohydrolase
VTRFEVWAPLAQSVRLSWRGPPVQLTPTARGYFAADVPDAVAGTEYRFVLNDGKPVPDPRSPHQPEGIDGPSRVVDHSRFQWTDAGFPGLRLASAVLYELHVGTFSSEGTFDGAIAHLDYLVDLGVDAVELMPVAQFSGRHGWGYDGVDLFAPHEAYGSPDSLKRLVDACHARGLGVILDVVYNHFGPAGNYLPQYGPYLTDRYKTPWGGALNFSYEDSQPVRDFVCENALSWLRDYHFDGLRLDAIHAIVDTSARHILEELSDRVAVLAAEVKRPLWLIAESDLNDPRIVEQKSRRGHGLDAQWSDDFHHALHAVLTGEKDGYYADFGTLEQLARALTDVFVYDGRYSEFRRRVHGRSAEGIPDERFVVYSQNHDQVGNRARGERTSQLVSPGLCRVAAALVLTAPFVPMLFQGEEWGASTPFLYFTDHADPELAQAVREGRAQEFDGEGFRSGTVPDPQAPETFERSRLRWDERVQAPHAEMFLFYRALLRLRREHPDLGGAGKERPTVTVDEARRVLVVRRGTVRIACNFSSERVELESSTAATALLASDAATTVADGTVTLTKESVLVYQDVGT